MWPILVEFRLVNWEIRRRKKGRRKKERKKESVAKYKTADMYVGRPNKAAHNNAQHVPHCFTQCVLNSDVCRVRQMPQV